jgi:hypothetical protein
MIIVHDEDFKLQHVIYEHPPDYVDLIDDGEQQWVQTHQRLPADQIAIGVHPQYGHRKVYHKDDGYWVDVIAMSDH